MLNSHFKNISFAFLFLMAGLTTQAASKGSSDQEIGKTYLGGDQLLYLTALNKDGSVLYALNSNNLVKFNLSPFEVLSVKDINLNLYPPKIEWYRAY